MHSAVLARTQETPDTVTIRVAADIVVTPGQFVMLGAPILPPLVPDGPMRELKRSYSVAGYHAPRRHRGDEPCAAVHEGHLGHDGWIELTIKEQPAGTFSRYAQTLAVGDPIALYGPFGKHFLWNPVGADPTVPLVLIAGGTGIAPFRFMIAEAIAQSYPGTMTLLFSVKTRSDIIYEDEIESWRRALPNLRIHVALTRPAAADLDGWSGLVGRIGEKAITDALGGDVLAARFYVCGPTTMVQDMTATLGRLGVPADAIRTEKYGAIDG
jgi:ferredoxin-NADP reductase